MLIVFEGIDGSGKSRQVRLLEEALAPRCPVEVIEAEDARPIRSLYNILLSSENSFPTPLMSLFLGLSDFAHVIDCAPRTEAGTVTLLHRYCYSTFADAIALGLPRALVCDLAPLFPAPDLTVFIATPPDLALERQGEVSLAEAGGPDFVSQFGDLASSFLEYQNRVKDAYEYLRDEGVLSGRILTVDGACTPEAIHADVCAQVEVALTEMGVSA